MDFVAMLTGPVGMGIGGVVVLGLLIYFGLPLVMGGNGADKARFKSMQAALKALEPARKDGKEKDAAKEMDSQGQLAKARRKSMQFENYADKYQKSR